MRSILPFVGCNLKKLLTSPKPYILFLLLYIILRIGVGGANTYLDNHGQTLQAVELFIFSQSSTFFQLVFITGLMLLQGDAPFLQEGMSFRLIRTSRKKWLTGQMVSCVIISAVYLAVIELLLVFLFRNHISFQNQWSNTIRLAAQTRTGGTAINIESQIAFPMDTLKAGTPYAIFGLTYLYNLLLYAFLSLVVIICNLRFKAGVSYFGVITLCSIRLLQQFILSYKLVWYLSPCSVVCLTERSVTKTGIAHTLIYLTLLCAILLFPAYRMAKHSDLLRGDYA